MHQLTSLDAQFLAMETPRTYGHVSGLAVYDPATAPGGEITIKDICRLVGERLHLLPPFRWKLVSVPFDLDHPYWIEDPNFDIDFHIRESAVPPPGTPDRVAETVSRIFARPLDRAHPLWEIYLIHGLEGGHVALMTKVHHAAVDGMSGAEILSVLLDESPEGREITPAEPRDPDRHPSQAEMLARGLLGLPRQPLRAARGVPSALANLEVLPGVGSLPGAPTVGRVVRRVLPGGPDGNVLDTATVRAPQTRFNSRISPHRRYAYGSVSLDRVKTLKNALGVTVNDVVVGLCATALREWLIEQDELPEDPLVAMVPLSTRTPDQMGTFGNRVSMMFVPIPTNVEDPRARLLQAHETMAVAKSRFQAVPADILQDVTRFVPPAVFARASRVTAQLGGLERLRPLNVVISNVPGPRNPLFLAGARLEAHYPVSVITDGAGLNITCLSYRDHVDFGIVADRDQMDDAWPLMRSIEAGLDELVEVICGAGRPKPKAATRRREKSGTTA
ncbi:MAG: wax ester/triacylglycerol synthase family O-acyltransferase [Actinomycetota bacterium]|nr:wax ester/triacylglycerol synthase family O-acyltransferase [Actinomycetota bacterium]